MLLACIKDNRHLNCVLPSSCTGNRGSFRNTTESSVEFDEFLLEYFEFDWSEEIPAYWDLDTEVLANDGN